MEDRGAGFLEERKTKRAKTEPTFHNTENIPSKTNPEKIRANVKRGNTT